MTRTTRASDDDFSDYVASRIERVRFTAYLLCGDWHEAEDIAQAAFVKLYVAWNRIDHGEPIDAYVHKVVVRSFLNERRGLWRKLERLTHSPPEPPPPPVDAPEDRIVVWQALSQVPSRQRAVLVLRFWEDLSLTETAEVLGCSVGTVKSQCSRGLRTLREILDRNGAEATMTLSARKARA